MVARSASPMSYAGKNAEAKKKGGTIVGFYARWCSDQTVFWLFVRFRPNKTLGVVSLCVRVWPLYWMAMAVKKKYIDLPASWVK